MPSYNSIGKIVATFGLRGEVILKHHLGKKTGLRGLELLYLEEKKDEMIPYFIETVRPKTDDELYLKLEGIDVKEKAQQLTQKQVWLAESDFHRFAGASAPISMLGFHIINDGTDLGEILEVIEQPHQLLCRIDLQGKEALIPVHPDALEKMDKTKKEIYMVLPEGLLDIYR